MAKQDAVKKEAVPSSLEYRTPLVGTPHEFGIPLETVIFHSSIQSHGNSVPLAGEPEMALYEEGSNPRASRTAKLWKSGDTLVAQQRGGISLIPWAKVSSALFKKIK